jgi:branched-subunit amino acid ABC-type transport system permease component
MDRFLQTLMDALAVGSLYALIALGYTMVYGILKFINFAHSDVFVLGAWTSFMAAMVAGWGLGEPASVAGWVVTGLGVITAVGLAILLYERYGQAAVLARYGAHVPRLRLGAMVLMVGLWGLVLLGVLMAARGLKGAGAGTLASVLILFIAMGTCGGVGFCIERLAYRPLRRAPRLNVLITAIGVSLFLQNIGQLDWMFGTRPQGMPVLIQDRELNTTLEGRARVAPDSAAHTLKLDEAISIRHGSNYTIAVEGPGGLQRVALLAPFGDHQPGGTVTIPAGDPVMLVPMLAFEPQVGAMVRVERRPRVPVRLVDVIGAGTAVLLMILLDWLVFRTRLGRAMRAVSFSAPNAALMGINVDRVISFTFVLGASLAAAAGFLHSQKYTGLNQTAAAGWVLLGLKAFVAAVVGGIGNIRGAMLGGLLIGMLEMFGRSFVNPQLSDVFVFGALILVLLFRPSGILGKAVTEKV